jgi:uncharacterized protein (DUF885 family)
MTDSPGTTPEAALPAVADAAAAVDALADRFWEALLVEAPLTATLYGDDRYDDRLPDLSAAGRARARSLREATLAELAAIPADGLPTEARITHDMLRVVCELGIRADDLRMDVIASVDQMDGPQTLLAQLVQVQRADTPERLAKLLARFAAFPRLVADAIELLDEGRADGSTAARLVAERVIAQTERLLAVPAAESALVRAPRLAGDAEAEGRARLEAAVERDVRPALARYLDAVRGPYLAATREDPGLWSAPRGEERYRAAMRQWTTLDLDPVEVHEIGLTSLVAIKEEQRAIARAAGFGDDIAAYREALHADTDNRFGSKAALVARATEDIGRAWEQAPRVFGRLPRASCEVRPVEAFMEADAPFAYYYPPATDGSRPGIYFVNAGDLPSRYRSNLASTTYHEAVPGHHFQISLEMEHPSLPAFRRLGARAVGSAYAEGWGLYSERLADELGLFRDEGERFGMLGGQAWRAARLVVDTGIHALRKDRAWGVGVLRDAGLTETDASIETDRYVVWPGQALPYMIGQRQIRALREELEARDGAAFDLRAFHDALLGHGSLPLATLARELPRWVAPRT